MSFLKAEWRKLAMANYVVDPEILKPYLPFKTALDLWEGKCYVSLVGFMFLETKVLGLKIPYHVNFEEVNLRFYVKHADGKGWKRGVVFIKEIVPKRMITFVANTVYKEHYETMKMNHLWLKHNDSLETVYQWKKDGKWNVFSVLTDINAYEIIENSEVEFITEHYWGYSHQGDKKAIEYEVRHPKWQHYPVLKHEIDVDFGSVYGNDFAFLKDLSPASVFLAEGSEISVESKKVIV